jgi:hypothetical protein
MTETNKKHRQEVDNRKSLVCWKFMSSRSDEQTGKNQVNGMSTSKCLDPLHSTRLVPPKANLTGSALLSVDLCHFLLGRNDAKRGNAGFIDRSPTAKGQEGATIQNTPSPATTSQRLSDGHGFGYGPDKHSNFDSVHHSR